jgi:hypothetical protein
MPAYHAAAPLIAALVCACASSANLARGSDEQDVASAPQMLARAIERAGGTVALEAARALTWEGDAIVNAGRIVEISGTWAIQPPDTAVVATFEVARGPGSLRALVIAAPRGWLVTGADFTPMPTAMLATERDEFYLYDVMRLVPLREPGVTLTAIASDSVGQPGFRAERAGRPATDLHFDSTGRLAHLRTRVADPAGGPSVMQDIWLSGEIESAGVRWPRDLRIYLNGQPFFALTLRTLRVHNRVEDPRLKGPGGP